MTMMTQPNIRPLVFLFLLLTVAGLAACAPSGVPDSNEAPTAAIPFLGGTPAESADLRPIPLPDLSDGPHLSYAVQWVIFAGVAVVGFVFLIRRESEYAAAGAALTDAGTPTAPPQPTGTID